MNRICSLAICAVSLLFLNCGPAEYLNSVTIKASQAVLEAKHVQAERLAPFEYWSAVEYLQMAKEKAAYADYQHALSYGKKSNEMAHEAIRLSHVRAAGQGVKINCLDKRFLSPMKNDPNIIPLAAAVLLKAHSPMLLTGEH